jgi:hypothetical protein
LLNLLRLGENQIWELWLTATGTFVINKAMTVLTSARCSELVNLGTDHLTGNLEEYTDLARSLPQVTI